MRGAALLSALLLAGCGGTGRVQFTTWGEAYVEEGIPAGAFADGWSVRYTRFLVAYRDVRIARTGGSAAFTGPPMVFDETRSGPTPMATTPALPAERWDLVSYSIAHDDAAEAGPGVTAADLALMNAGRYSVYVEGAGTRGARTVRFAWGFAKDTAYQRCRHPDLGGAGVVVPTGATEAVQLTVHGDHLFYDDLQSPSAVMRFEALAGADADGDGQVTLAELRGVLLTALPWTSYGTGGAPRVKNLEDFVGDLSRTVGHYRGEGECDARPL